MLFVQQPNQGPEAGKTIDYSEHIAIFSEVNLKESFPSAFERTLMMVRMKAKKRSRGESLISMQGPQEVVGEVWMGRLVTRWRNLKG